LDSRKDRAELVKHLYDKGLKLPLRNSTASSGQTTCQATITLHNGFSGTPSEARLGKMTKQATPDWDCACIPFAPALILCLFEAKAQVCTQKMVKDGLNVYFASFHNIAWAV
jgi:hypothetical protein